MKGILTLALICFSSLANAQDATVEKSIFGIQTNLLGVFANNELRLAGQISLRSEIGYVFQSFSYSSSLGTDYMLAPIFTLEPRWYYNLSRRLEHSKNIRNNSGNFISLTTSFHPNFLLVTSYDPKTVNSYMSIIPTWGLRRVTGNHFTYELGAGIGGGYRFYSGLDNFYLAINLLARIGYTF